MISIAIVEDDELIGRGLNSLLLQVCPEAEDIHVFVSAQDAIVYFDDHPFDVLLTDIEMPGINGLGLIDHLRQRCPGLLCVIITGYDSFDYARRGLQLGVLDYLLKPVDDEDLRNAMNKAKSVLSQRSKTEEELQEISRRFIYAAYHHPEQMATRLQVLKEQCVTVSDMTLLLYSVENAFPGIKTHREEGLWQRWDHLIDFIQTARRNCLPLELAVNVSKYLGEHFREELSVNRLAELFHVTPAYLGQVYRKMYHQSINTALHQARILHAKVLLQNDTLSIAQIANDCGYKTLDHFYRQFRRFEDETPASYRDQCKN